MAYLVLVRHGQSQWNLENRFTGWTDVPLTEEGKAEAERAGHLLHDLPVDRAFTSLLRRAQETLAIILRALARDDLPIVRDAALNERDYGDLTGMNKDEAAARFGAEQVHAWRRSWDTRPPGGESLADTDARAFPFFRDYILPRVTGGEDVFVVAHGNSLRAIVKEIEGLTPAQVVSLEIATATPYVYMFDAEGRILHKEIRTPPTSPVPVPQPDEPHEAREPGTHRGLRIERK
ncbi:MAG: 2,3-bisphosphoglycerate-dependent phosphoglycerate mutase [Thermomicrobia bacterium]|nr:2,3-bisphosphoglycerate-dependent phosphoglycerate mutase [Thermomicrobia bacterium]MCA1725227.1 2,3-bisphosphoglycerate-dependent phosphoglycerate mutase [Thermomicrobia bacterium]